MHSHALQVVVQKNDNLKPNTNVLFICQNYF
jgi:hypothetical protein